MAFLAIFLSKGLKTNQLVVNTDEKTLRPIARLKEPRDLFALPKDKDNDCSQQAPRWPVECQVIEERIIHIPYVPAQPEPLNVPTGNELKPRPVGEENGIVVFNYCPISAVNYGSQTGRCAKTEDKSSDDSDDSSDSRNDCTPNCRRMPAGKSQLNSISKILNSVENRSTSNSQDDDDDDDDETSGETTQEARDKIAIQNLIEAKKKRYEIVTPTPAAGAAAGGSSSSKPESKQTSQDNSEIDDIWKNNSTEYKPASPHYVLSQFGKKVSKAIIEKIVDHSEKPSTAAGSGVSKVHNKYAVTPFKLPKTNITRLEVAFQNSARQCFDKVAQMRKKNIAMGEPEEDLFSSGDDCSTDNPEAALTTNNLAGQSSAAAGRLTGGADKRPCSGSSSVSDTETLVGEESLMRLATAAHADDMQSPLSTRVMSMAAAVAAVARGRRRFDPTHCDDFEVESNSSSFNTNTNTTTTTTTSTSTYTSSSFELGSDKLNTEFNFNDSNYKSPNTSYEIPQMQFSRSAVGGAKFISNCHPLNNEEYDSLEFESRFESGNLAKAVQITPTYYELYLRPDLYTSRSKQWFYFRVRRTRRNMLYRFSIVNLVKSDSLYNDGMRPVMYSNQAAKVKNEGWRRCGNNICYYRNDDESNSNANNEEDEDNSSYTLTFTIEFDYDDDTVFFAHSYPYTYSDLQDYLMEIQRHPVKSKFCKLRLLCRTLAGNNVYYLTVTAPSSNEENMRRKKSIVVSARVHPSETPASWMMKGLMDFITGDTTVAKRLRHKFIFKLVPMLNPDGVIVGNTRNSLTGKDLNRQYRTVIRETYPSIWYTKAMIRRLIEECGVAMYCDMHAHSRKHNIFIYGCENKRNPEKKLTEQVFPLMLHKNSADRFSFESCKFKIQRSKEGTGRIVVWMLGITNSYTIEASFGGSSLGSRKGTHFNTQDYEHMGRAFCETLLDYCDENPNKERLRSKIIERLMREGSSADEPLNIPLSDYSSDEGNCSSSSDNEGKHSITASDLEGPCCAPTRAPPSSPEVLHEIRKFRVRRMHKVMHVLDQIYFSPVLQRKFKALARLKRRRHKVSNKPNNAKRATGGSASGGGSSSSPNGSANVNLTASEARVRSQITIRTSQQPQPPVESESSESLGSQSSEQSDELGESKPAAMVKQQSSGSSRKRGKQKRKVMPIEKKNRNINRKMRVDRNLRLWLANRRIFIFRRKKNRRPRVRSKPQKKRNEVARTTLDLPTTDPGSDLHFSTDDEEHAPTGNTQGFGAVAPLRHTLLQSELQRRYIEEIGDMVVQKPKPAHMPPELIVTTPSKSCGPGGIKKYEVYKLTPRTAPEQVVGQLQGQTNVNSARRTYSWHNLNQESKANFFVHEPKPVKLHKPPSRRNVPSNFIPLAQQRAQSNPGNAEDLQLKLSLKKKIWTGAHGDADGRPLAWCKAPPGQAHGQMANVMATAAAAAAIRSAGGAQTRNIFNMSSNKDAGSMGMPTALPAAYMSAPRKPRKLDQMDLFNACSQKLLMWQQEHKKMPPNHARLLAGNSGKLDDQQQLFLRGGKPLTSKKNSSKQSGGGGGGGGGGGMGSAEILQLQMAASTGKTKRKSSSMMKIAETTQLVTRFTRTRANAGAGGGSAAQSSSTAQQQQQLTQMQRLLFKNQMDNSACGTAGVGGMRVPSKFRTGGLVVTAVQQTNAQAGGSSSRRMRHAAGLHVKGGVGSQGTMVGATSMLAYRNNSLVQANKSAAGISLDTVSLVRKVKTKLKKRKSRSMASAAAAAASASAK